MLNPTPPLEHEDLYQIIHHSTDVHSLYGFGVTLSILIYTPFLTMISSKSLALATAFASIALFDSAIALRSVVYIDE